MVSARFPGTFFARSKPGRPLSQWILNAKLTSTDLLSFLSLLVVPSVVRSRPVRLLRYSCPRSNGGACCRSRAGKGNGAGKQSQGNCRNHCEPGREGMAVRIVGVDSHFYSCIDMKIFLWTGSTGRSRCVGRLSQPFVSRYLKRAPVSYGRPGAGFIFKALSLDPVLHYLTPDSRFERFFPPILVAGDLEANANGRRRPRRRRPLCALICLPAL